MTAAQRERAALVDTMRTVGPDAPTLCGDWTTRDLAAHLVVRERRLDATAGVAVPFLAGYTAKVQRQVTQSTDWDVLLDKIASGPPLYSPFKILDPVANMGEMFIHHEDVRRAQADWEPRSLDDATVSALGRGLPIMARLTLAGGRSSRSSANRRSCCSSSPAVTPYDSRSTVNPRPSKRSALIAAACDVCRAVEVSTHSAAPLG